MVRVLLDVPRHWCCWLVLVAPSLAVGQIEYLKEPFLYQTAPTTDRVQKLQQALQAGKAKLDHDDDFGYLKSVLKALRIPAESQVLVFSKTSLQISRISPRRPRAIYFNDDSYVGYIPGSDVLEISSVDPKLGAIFYTLRQKEVSAPAFRRDRGQCLACHDSARTQRIPGHLVRSVYPQRSGLPVFASGTYTTDHRTEFKKRFGGWYVTGTHGKMRHMGNAFVGADDRPEAFDREKGANVTSLKERFDTTLYLRPDSDIVALMVLEHQTQMHNYLALARYETISATHYDKILNKALDRPSDYISDSTKRRVKRVVDQLIDFMFFRDEFKLSAAVKGSGKFQSAFEARGGESSVSLRKLNLKERMFQLPCSFLIESEAFEALPQPALAYAMRRISEVLSEDGDPQHPQLSRSDRAAIRNYLRTAMPKKFGGLFPPTN